MSLDHFSWSGTESTLIPMILQLRLSNSGFSPAMYPSSVVHTGVKFFRCENRIAHPFPIHSWKLIFPWVVSAVKFGASLLIRSVMTCPPHRLSKLGWMAVGAPYVLPAGTGVVKPRAGARAS